MGFCTTLEVDDVYYYICWRLKLKGETENMGVCTKVQGLFRRQRRTSSTANSKFRVTRGLPSHHVT